MNASARDGEGWEYVTNVPPAVTSATVARLKKNGGPLRARRF
jgi:hypothetical protein